MVQLPKLKQITTPEGRRYEVEGTEVSYPSITTVLGGTADKSGLFEWRKRVGEEKANAISRAAAARGTSMHKLCERYLLNEDLGAMPHDEEFEQISEGDWSAGQLMFTHIKPALDRMDNVRVLEGRLFSHALGVAGTVDCIAEIDGDLAVVDFKTSRRMKYKDGIEDYFLQGCFYFSAYYEMTGELPKQITILISVQDGTLCEYTIQGKEIIEYTEILKKRIRHWHYKNKKEVPRGAKACY